MLKNIHKWTSCKYIRININSKYFPTNILVAFRSFLVSVTPEVGCNHAEHVVCKSLAHGAVDSLILLLTTITQIISTQSYARLPTDSQVLVSGME